MGKLRLQEMKYLECAEPRPIESGVLTLVLTQDISMQKCTVSKGSCHDFTETWYKVIRTPEL